MSKDPSKPAAPAVTPPVTSPPVTSKAKIKPVPRGPATKAEHAAMKRIDKMVIKRMRKR